MRYPIVMPTDTLYGLVAPVFDRAAMRRLRKLKGRSGKFIILISSQNDLAKFKVKLTPEQKRQLKKFWPGPVSVVLGRYAFRLPKPRWLRKFLRREGPLAAPSANPAAKPPARNIAEAKKYFGDQVQTYLAGRVKKQASTLIKLSPSGQITVLR